jgi:hypothetical protein
MRTLTVKRKADREAMAKELEARLKALGAAVVRCDPWQYAPRRIGLVVSANHGERSASIRVDFDGDSTQPDIHVACWNASRGHCFHPFAMGFNSVNPHHFGKATRIGYGFLDMAVQLECDVERIVSGEAFCLEREAAKRADYAASARA